MNFKILHQWACALIKNEESRTSSNLDLRYVKMRTIHTLDNRNVHSKPKKVTNEGDDTAALVDVNRTTRINLHWSCK